MLQKYDVLEITFLKFESDKICGASISDNTIILIIRKNKLLEVLNSFITHYAIMQKSSRVSINLDWIYFQTFLIR